MHLSFIHRQLVCLVIIAQLQSSNKSSVLLSSDLQCTVAAHILYQLYTVVDSFS